MDGVRRWLWSVGLPCLCLASGRLGMGGSGPHSFPLSLSKRVVVVVGQNKYNIFKKKHRERRTPPPLALAGIFRNTNSASPKTLPQSLLLRRRRRRRNFNDGKKKKIIKLVFLDHFHGPIHSYVTTLSPIQCLNTAKAPARYIYLLRSKPPEPLPIDPLLVRKNASNEEGQGQGKD